MEKPPVETENHSKEEEIQELQQRVKELEKLLQMVFMKFHDGGEIEGGFVDLDGEEIDSIATALHNT